MSDSNAFGLPTGGSYYTIYSTYEILEETVIVIKNIVFGVGLFILIIGCLFSLSLISKEISSNKKEIGLYRSLGATLQDIKNIYINYILILSLVAYLFSITISYVISFILNYFFSDYIYLGVMMINSYSLEITNKPPFLMLSFPILEMLGLFIIILLFSIIFNILPLRKIAKIEPTITLKSD